MEERKVEFLRTHFEQIENQVQFGDHKASLLVAGDAILLATCRGLIKVVSGCPKEAFTVSCVDSSPPLVLAMIAAGLLVCSLFRALQAALPNPVHRKPPKRGARELFLLGHVANMQCEDFRGKYEEIPYSELVEQALITIHGKSAYANRKFMRLRWAIQTTLLSLVFIVLTVLAAVASRILA